MRIREDFAAAGGISLGLRWAGLPDGVGVEFEESACLTARAAGFRRIHADVRAVRDLDWSPLDLYAGGPPCQTFSAAGNGEGRKHLASLARAVRLVMVDGMLPEDAIRTVADDELDERSILVLEPALVVHRHRPTRIILEQVPQVLPVWQAYVEVLREVGYSADTRVLQAEQYGVPQTRKRAILIATLDGEAVWPTPTHSAFYPHDRARLDEGVLPWVSMAQALGWGMRRRPYPTVACSRNSGGPDKEKVGGSGARKLIYAERVEGAWTHGPGCECPDLDWCGEPVPAVDGTVAQSFYESPSPTIVGSFHPEVVAARGYRKPGDPPRQKTPGSVRVTVQEASVLQSFPADWPWQGTSTQQFQQVGNAAPPLMMEAVARALFGLPPRTWG